jgi:hypothetical protein
LDETVFEPGVVQDGDGPWLWKLLCHLCCSKGVLSLVGVTIKSKLKKFEGVERRERRERRGRGRGKAHTSQLPMPYSSPTY